MPGQRKSRRQSHSHSPEPSSEADDIIDAADAQDGSGAESDSHFPETQFQPVDNSQDDDELYAVKSVLGEDTKARLYLLEWDGLDAETGYDYRPTWEPKEGCTDDLIKEWKKAVAADPAKRDKKYANKQLKAWDDKFRLWERSKKRKLSKTKRSSSPAKQGRASDAGVKRKKRDEDEEEEEVSRKKTRTKTKTPSVRHASAAPSATPALETPALRRTRQSLGAPSPLAESRTAEKRTSARSRSNTATIPPTKPSPVKKKSTGFQGSPERPQRSTRASSSLKARSASPRQTRGKGKQTVGFADQVESDDEDGQDEQDEVYAAQPDFEQELGDDDLDILDQEDQEPVRKSSRTSEVRIASAGPSSKVAVKSKADGKSKTTGGAGKGDSQGNSTFDEETFPDPRNAEDETYRPPSTRVSRSTPSKNGAANGKASASITVDSPSKTSKSAGAKGKSKALGPVPQPPLSAFKQPNARATPTQATVSTEDDIQSFSSPVPAKKHKKDKEGKKSKDSTRSSTTSKEAESMEETETGLIRKKVDGEWVLVPAGPPSPSRSQDQEEQGARDGAKEAAQAEIEGDGQEESPAYPETQAQTQLQGMKKKVRGGEVMYVPEDETDSSDEEGGGEDGAAELAEGETGETADDPAAEGADGDMDVDVSETRQPEEPVQAEVLVEETLVTSTTVETAAPLAAAANEAVVSSQVDKIIVAQATADAAAQTVVQSAEATPAAMEDQSAQVDTEMLQPKDAVETSESSKTPNAAPSPPVTEGGEDLSDLVTELRAQIRDLQSRNATLIEEGSFLRDQYSSASTIAATQAQEASRLQAEVDRKSKQLRIGIKQRDVHWKAIIDARESEETRLKGTIKILTDQSRLTDDRVRHKAAMYDAMHAANEQFGLDNQKLHDRLVEMKKDNDRLNTQVEYLKMQLREAGTGKGRDRRVEEEDDMDMELDDGMETESDAESTGDEGNAKQSMRKKGYAVRQATSSMVSIPAADIAGPGGASQIARATGSGEIGAETEAQGNGVVCQYNVAGGVCGLVAETREALEVHLREHTQGIQPLP